MVNWAFIDRDDALRPEREVPHHGRDEPNTNETLLRKPDSAGRWNQWWNVNAHRPRKIFPLFRELLGIGDARQRAAAAHAEVLATTADGHTSTDTAHMVLPKRLWCFRVSVIPLTFHFTSSSSTSNTSVAFGGNHAAGAAGAVAQCPVEWSARAAADLHAGNALIPPESPGRRRAETRTARCDPSSCRTWVPRLSSLGSRRRASPCNGPGRCGLIGVSVPSPTFVSYICKLRNTAVGHRSALGKVWCR